MRTMKDSGVEWVGNIPERWETKQMRACFLERKRPNTSCCENNLLSLSYGNIVRKDMEGNRGLLPESFSGYNIIERGDIVFRLTDLQNDRRSLRTGLSSERGIITSAYTTVFPKPCADARYYGYLFRAYDQAKVFYNMGGGVRQGINWSELKRVPLIVPPIDEQRRIAAFLDERCAAIDAERAALEGEVRALRRLRKATIQRAVTKGVREGVCLKDSRIDWIGNIPSHWVCCKQKHAFRLINGRAYANDEFEIDGKYRILRVGNLFSNPDWYTSSMELPSDKYCEDGDLLYSWSMSYGPVIWSGEKVIYHYHIWKVDLSAAVSKQFAYYYLLALTDAIQAEVHETTMGFLTMGVMNNSYIALPPLDEQDEIVECLSKRCADIDAVIDTRTAQIARLEDYRKALIFQYVTGKKEVPCE